jgi:hypothetical protein
MQSLVVALQVNFMVILSSSCLHCNRNLEALFGINEGIGFRRIVIGCARRRSRERRLGALVP